MTSPNLPPAIIEHFAAQMDAATRVKLKAAQAAMSARYREGGHSRDAVPDPVTALAYAVARMPATYAACVRAFDLVAATVPNFAPERLLDLGAGPGTATMAAASVWPTVAVAHLVEPNAGLADLAEAALPVGAGLAATLVAADLTRVGLPLPPSDLVVLSYVLAEQPLPVLAQMIARALSATIGVIVIVEPGTPAGYRRILVARDAMISAGLNILAPCPHARACPLPTDDWCHFSVRLQRSAGHRHLKEADVAFEDERFSFIAASRGALPLSAVARLIRPVMVEKGFADVAVCAADGLETRRIKRRNGAAYKAAKGLTWGDAVG